MAFKINTQYWILYMKPVTILSFYLSWFLTTCTIGQNQCRIGNDGDKKNLSSLGEQDVAILNAQNKINSSR